MRPLLVPLVLVILTACAGKSGRQTSSASDTTQVIELALKTALGEHFPEMDAVKRKGQVNDSIFLTTSVIPISNLPSSVDSFRFKILPDTMICSVIKKDTISPELPNYLRLQTFVKTDTGYYVQIESVVCIPASARDASVSLNILKTKDKFVFNRN